jgi:hypothetical protein
MSPCSSRMRMSACQREGGIWGSKRDILTRQDILNYDVEWAKASDSDEEEFEGLAFKGGFWVKEGLDARSIFPGVGKDSPEVWF